MNRVDVDGENKSSPCLDDETIFKMVEGQLTPGDDSKAWQHVDTCEDCGRRLDSAAGIATAGATADVTAPPDLGEVDELPQGTMLGRYVVLHSIGKGGLGLVYAAYDPELDRKVAVKLLRPAAVNAVGAAGRMRLVREARAMARLSHPNVVSVFDVGTYGESVFVAMELVRGNTLRGWLRATKPSWRAIRDVLVEAGEGLAAAHAAGMVHRDLKPGNVLVADSGEVKVVDFGLARSIAEQDSEAWSESIDEDFEPETSTLEPITRQSELMGTPGYMAPEQFTIGSPIDARSDQFAFCVTLYEALYRSRPFRGANWQEIRKATLEGSVTPPKFDPGVPSWLHRALLKGLSANPDHRYADIRELLDGLTRDRRSRRRQRIIFGASIAATAVLVGSISLLWRPAPDPAAQSEIDELTARAREAAARNYFVYPPPDDVAAPTAYTAVLQLEELDEAEREADARAAELRGEFSQTLVRLGDHFWDQPGGKRFASEYYTEALFFDPDHERARDRTAITPGELAAFRAQAAASDFSEAELRAGESLAVLAETDEKVRSERLTKLRKRGGPPTLSTAVELERLLGPESGAIAQADPPKKAPKVLPPPPDDGAETGEPESAETGELEQGAEAGELVVDDDGQAAGDGGANSGSTATSEKAGGNRPRDPGRARELASKASAAFKANQLDRAETLYHQALERDPQNLAATIGLAELNFERGRYRQALRFAKRATQRAPKKGRLWILLGDSHFKVLEYTEARKAYEKARQLGHASAAGRLSRLEKTLGK